MINISVLCWNHIEFTNVHQADYFQINMTKTPTNQISFEP